MQNTLLLSALTVSLTAFAIVGGQKAIEGQFPSTVLIVSTMCTGVKVGPRHFLSARHCTKETAGDEFSIQWGMEADVVPPIRWGVTVESFAPSSTERRWNVPTQKHSAALTLARTLTHPGGNLTLYEVNETTPALPAVPIRTATPPTLYELVAMNGYGCIDHEGSKHPYDPKYFPFDQKFAIKHVANINGLFIDLPHLDPDGVHNSSICYVDSGGPLYARSEHGQLELVGIAEYTSTAESGEVVSSYNRLDEGTITAPGELSAGAWLRSILF